MSRQRPILEATTMIVLVDTISDETEPLTKWFPDIQTDTEMVCNPFFSLGIVLAYHAFLLIAIQRTEHA